MTAQQDVGQTVMENEVPVSEPLLAPQSTFQPPIHHKGSIWSEVLAILAIVVLVAIIIDILLDADVINLPLPHTSFFDY